MLYCPNFFWNVLQVWMTGKDVYLQMTWSWPDKTWNILCSYCLQWNTSQSKFRNHYFLFLFAFSILSQLFLIWGCIITICLTHSGTAVFHKWHMWSCWKKQHMLVMYVLKHGCWSWTGLSWSSAGHVLVLSWPWAGASCLGPALDQLRTSLNQHTTS